MKSRSDWTELRNCTEAGTFMEMTKVFPTPFSEVP